MGVFGVVKLGLGPLKESPREVCDLREPVGSQVDGVLNDIALDAVNADLPSLQLVPVVNLLYRLLDAFRKLLARYGEHTQLAGSSVGARSADAPHLRYDFWLARESQPISSGQTLCGGGRPAPSSCCSFSSIAPIHRTELTRVVRHDDTIADQVFFEARSLQGSLRPAPFRSAQIELGLDLPDGTEAGAEREAGGGGGEGRGERRKIRKSVKYQRLYCITYFLVGYRSLGSGMAVPYSILPSAGAGEGRGYQSLPGAGEGRV